MGIFAKLQWGTRTLDLESPPFSLRSFVPPAINESANMAVGTSANRFGGGEVVSYKAQDRGWSFSVRVLGTTAGDVDGSTQRLTNFLRLVKDKTNKLFLAYKSSDDYDFDPLWGQFGGPKLYHIKIVRASYSRLYNASDKMHTKAQIVRLSLTIAPHAAGLEQSLASARGGVLEDTIGTVDGLSRGTIIPEATTNKFTNPIFGHSTFDNNWTAVGSLNVTKNTDKNFILFGSNSVKLVGDTQNRNFYETIDVGNTDTHIISCYAKMPDGTAVVAGVVKLTYDGVLTTTFTSVGNGWYRLSAEVTGVDAGVVAGVRMEISDAVYLDGFHLENKLYITPMAHGNMMGVAWSGTPHDSTSVRAVARIRLDGSLIDLAGATFRLVMKMNNDSTDGTDPYFFRDSSSNFILFYDNTGSTIFKFLDGTNTASSSSQSWSAGDIIVLHCTLNVRDGLIIYRDGVSIGSEGTYTPPNVPTYIALGSRADETQHSNVTFLGCATFARAMSATEVLADFNNISPHISGGDGLGQRLEAIPRVWTKDGDRVVDMYADSTHDDFAIVEGIPGSAPADTVFQLTNSATDRSLILGLLAIDRFIELSDYFTDEQGTGDGTALNAEVKRTSVDAAARISTAAGPVLTNYEDLIGQPAHIFASIKDNGGATNLQIRMQLDSNFTLAIGKYKSIIATTSLKQFLTKGIVMPFDISRDVDWAASATYAISLIAKFASGTANVDLDFWRVIFGKVAVIELQSSDSRGAYIRGSEVYGLLVTTNATEEYPKLRGEEIELVPDKVNHLIILSGDEGDATVLAATTEITRVLVTPRWSLA